MSIIQHIEAGLNEYHKKAISQENLAFCRNLERFVKAGTLQILYALSKAHLRLGEIQYFLKIPNSILVPELARLQKKLLVEKQVEKFSWPRKEEASIYKLTRRGKKLATLILPDPEMDVETYGGLIIKKELREWVEELTK